MQPHKIEPVEIDAAAIAREALEELQGETAETQPHYLGIQTDHSREARTARGILRKEAILKNPPTHLSPDRPKTKESAANKKRAEAKRQKRRERNLINLGKEARGRVS